MIALKINAGKQEILIRYTLMLLLAIFIAHYLSYQKLPFFSPDYSFPIQTFIVVTIFGIFICETNTYIYSYLNSRKPFVEKIRERLLWQYGLTLSSTVLVFSILFFIINMVIFNRPFNFFTFSLYLGICLFISAFEATVYTSRELYKSFVLQKKKNLERKNDLTGSFQFKVNTKTYNLLYHEIAYLFSSKGMVSIYDKDGKKYLSNFTSLNEIPPLPEHLFFRINRQMIINKKVIYSFKTIENRKTTLFLREGLKNGFGDIIISRYKSAAFKKWYNYQNGNE